MTTPEKQLLIVSAQITQVQRVLGTLIAWMAQSANSPIRVDEANKLLLSLEAPIVAHGPFFDGLQDEPPAHDE